MFDNINPEMILKFVAGLVGWGVVLFIIIYVLGYFRSLVLNAFTAAIAEYLVRTDEQGRDRVIRWFRDYELEIRSELEELKTSKTTRTKD